MRSILLCCLLIVFFQRISVQGVAMEPGPIPSGASQMSVLINPNWKSNTAMAGQAWETHAGVTGSMFCNEDWAKGWVLLKSKEESGKFTVFRSGSGKDLYIHRDLVRI